MNQFITPKAHVNAKRALQFLNRNVVLVFLLLGGVAQAQVTKTSTTIGNWSTVTWSPAGLPATIDDAIIATNVTVNQNTTVNNLTINSGSTLTMSGAFTLTVSGTLTINGILAGSTGTGLIAVTGNSVLNGTGALNLAAGSFTASGTTTLNGTSTISDGSATGTNTFTGLLTVNSGTNFSPANNSPFVFGGGISNAGTFNKSGTGAVTINNAVTIGGTSAITMAGAVTMNGATVINNTASTTFPGAVIANSTLTLNSSAATNFSTTIASTGLVTLSGTGTTTVTGISTFTGGATTSTGTTTILTGNSIIGAGTTFTNNGTVSVTGSLTLGTAATAASYTNNGTANITGALTGAAAGSTWTNAANSTLNYANTAAPMATGVLTASASPNTVNYSIGAQTIKGADYNTLTLGGATVTKTLGGITTVANALTIPATITLANSTFALTLSNTTINGALTLGAGNFTASGTIANNGTFSDASATGTNTLSGAFTNSGTFSTTNNPSFTFQNGLINNGTMTATGTGTYTFSTNTQTISGTNAITFAGPVVIASAVTFNNSATNSFAAFTTNAGGSVTFAGAGGTTISGISTLNGNLTLNAGSTITHSGAVTIGVVATYLANGVPTIVGALTGLNATTSIFTLGANQTFLYSNAAAPMVGGVFDASAAGTTVNYSGAAQSIAGGVYNNLVLSGTNTKTLGGNTTVNNALIIPSPITLANSTFSLTLPNTTINLGGTIAGGAGSIIANGTITNNGTVTAGAGAFIVSGTITNGGAFTLGTGNFTASSTFINNSTFNDASVTGTNIFTGLFTNVGTFTNTGNAALDFRGGLTNNGTMTAPGTGTMTFSTNPQTISGTNAITFAGPVVISSAVTFNNSAAYSFSSSFTTNVGGSATFAGIGATTITGATILNGDFTLNAGVLITHSGAVTIGAGVTYLANGVPTISGALTGLNPTTSIFTLGAGLTLSYSNAAAPMAGGVFDASAAGTIVNYSGAAQTIAGGIYNNLVLSGSGIKTLGGNTTVNSAFTIPAAITLNTSTYNFTALSTLTNNGTLTHGTGNISITGAITNAITTGTISLGGGNFTALSTIQNNGTFNDANALGTNIFTGLFTNTGTFTNSGNGSFDFRGSLTNNGTMTSTGTGTMTFSTNPQTVSGTNAITFIGPVVIASAVTFNNSAAYNFSSTFTTNVGGSAIFAGTGATTITGATILNGNFTLNASVLITHSGAVTIGAGTTYLANGVPTINGALTGLNAATSVFTLAAGLTLNYSNAAAPMAGGVFDASAAGTTVNYSGAAQTIAGGIYNNLVLSGTNTKTLGGNTIVNTALVIPAGITLALSAFDFTALSTITNNGTFNDAALAGTNIITGLFTNALGATFSASFSPSFDFRGGLTNNGTMTATSGGTYSFTTNPQTISGSSPITFAGNFTNNAPVVFAGAGVTTISGTTNVNASFTLNSGVSITHSGNVAIASGVTYYDNGNATIVGALTGANLTSTFLIGPGLTFNYANAAAPMTGGVIDASAVGTTFNYSGASQSVAGGSYNTLVFTGSGTKTLVGDIVVNNLINVPIGITLNLSSFNFTSNGGIVVSGTFTDSSPLGTNLIVGLFSNVGTFSNPGNASFEFQNGITNTGATFSSGTGTFLFSTNNQNISGISATTFSGNVNIGDNVTFTNNIPSLTINGVLTGLSATANFTAADNTTLTYGSNTVPMSGGNINVSVNPNTFIYSSNSGTQNVKETTYHNLTFSNNATRNVPNITVNGNFVRSGGGISASSTSLTFETSNSATFSSAGTMSFPNIIVNKAGGSLTLTPSAGGQTTTMLSLTVGAGSFAFSSAFTTTLTVTENLSGAGTLDMSSIAGHTLNLGGSTNVIQTYLAPAATGSTTVNYNRAGDQTMFASANYRNVGITGNGDKSLTGALAVDGILNLAATSGKIILGSSNLKIKPAGSITAVAFSSSRMIVTDGAGMLMKEVTTANPFAGSFIFPIGSNNVYTPYTISTISATYTGVAYVGVRAVALRQPNVPYYNNALIRYWDVVTANLTISNASIAYLYVNTPGEVVGSNAFYVPRVWNGLTLSAPPTPSGASTNPLTSSGTTFLAGQWTAIDPTIRTTLYSYQSGDWDNLNTWTTDPSGSTLVSSIIPGSGDQVVILNGRTITTTVGKTVGALTIENGGTLDLGSTSGHVLGSVDGQGLLRLSSVNYPGGLFTSFVSSNGGTIEYYNLPVGANVLASTPTSVNTYNNLIISNSTSTAFSANLNASTTVNGNFTLVKTGTGTTTFNLGSASGNWTLNLLKDVTIGTGCILGVNNAYNGSHQVNIYGNLDVTGTLDLTNGLPYTTPSNGRASLKFLGGVINTLATFNAGAVADLFDVSMQKNEGFELYVNASPTASVGFNGSGYTINPILGTLRLGANITIPRLGGGGNYDLGAAGVLPVFWIDGANVTDGGLGGAIVPYGTLKITAGSLTCVNGQGAVVLRESGLLQIDGGVVNMRIFRTSTTAITHRGSFVMNGGTLNITGDNGGEGSFYSMFSLPYAENVFQMAGGTINITRTVGGGITPRGGIMIASNAQNQQVTGGTVNVNVTGNQAFDITSAAPFYNMNISKASAGTGVFNLNPISWSYDGGGGNTAIIPAQPLRILNNLTMNGAIPLSVLGNGNNFQVAGNLTINSGVTFSSGLGSLVFNGNTAQTFTMSGIVGAAGIGGLTVNKNTLSTLSLAGSLTNIPFTGDLNLLSGTLADGGKSLLFKGNIINSAAHTGAGRIILNGTTMQSIGGSGTGTFQNLEFANTGGVFGAVQVTATNTLRVNGNFTLTTDRRMSIDIYKLMLSASSQIIGTFSVNRFIQTAGFLSDGGIVKPFNSTAAFVFPLGTGTNYTPSTIQFSSAPTTWGTLDVRPVTARQLYVTDPNTFIYHWKVRQTGFVGVPANSVNLTFNYGSLADNTAYIPAFYDYASIAFTPINDVTKVDEVTNNILFTGVSYFNGDFTAGSPVAFGTVIPFYSRANGSWNSPSTWSNNATLKHAGAAATAFPSANSPVIIGDGVTYFHTVTIPNNNTVSGSLLVDAGSTLDLGITTGNNFGALPYSTAGGAGRIKISSAAALAEFPAGDFGIFFTTEGGTTEYYAGSSSFAIPTFSAAPTSMQIRSYKNLILNPSATKSVILPNRSLEVFSNLTVNGNAAGIAKMNDFSNQTLTIRGNLVATSGKLQFGSGIAQNVNIDGDINIAAAGALSVENAGSESHSISLLGNIINNGTIDFSQASVVNISMIGANSRSISGTTPTASTSLNKLTINKGTSELTLVNVDVQGTLTAPSNDWLTLQNGTFRISKATTLTLTDAVATNFLIPSTAALSLNHVGVVVNSAMGASNASDVILAGTLEILNGTMNIGNPLNNVHNDLEYSASDIPILLVQGNGTLNVNGQIRRSVSVLLGSLNYTQKNNSTVLVRGKNPETAASFNLNRAKFEIVNPGSQFTMMDNSLLIIDRKGLASGIYGDFTVNPSSSVITGGEIRFGTTDTPPSATESTFLINTTTSFWNLTVDGTTTNKTVRLTTDPIVIKNNFSVLGGSVFDANSLNLTIGGNFYNENISSAAGISVGGYRPGNINQTTTFNGTSAVQQMWGVFNNLSNFGNLVLDNTFAGGSVDLVLNSFIRVNGNLTINNGGFNTLSNLATVAGNVSSNQIHTSTAGGYLVMGGTSNQTFTSNGNAQYGSVKVSNAAGIETDNALRINGDLNFTSGLFYINNNELTLGQNATVSGTFNASSMIRMNGVSSDGGVKKLYPGSASDFTFPVGVTLKYTPARINVTSNSVAGAVTMKLGNVKHPATTDVANKELTYYWSTLATGFNPATTVTHTYNYLQTDAINGVEANYRTGRYVNNVWTPQFGIASSVNSTSNTMTLSGVNYFNGDFTAGEQSEFDQLLVFYSRNATLGGNWNDANSWSTDPILTHAGAAAVTAPTFNSVVIAAGHTVTATANGVSSPTAQLDGTLNLGNYIGHNLGTVTGTGTVQLAATALNQFIFPAGTFASFVAPGGGTIEYTSATATSSLPSQGIYNNLVFSGAGAKSLFNSDITVNGNLTINAGSITNPSNRNISLKGNLSNVAGTSAMQLGSIGGLQLTGGAQSLTGATTLGKLTINGAGVKSLNSSLTIDNQLILTNGIIQTGANQVSLSLGALSSGASTLSYVNGNFRKVISASTSLRTFEVGDAITYAPITLQFNGNTNSGGSITAFSRAGDHPSSATSGIDGSKSVNRYWGLTNTGVTGFTDISATLNFVTSDLDPAVNPSNLSAARYNAPTWTAATVGTTTSSSLQITGLTTLGEFQLAEPFSSGITWTGSVNTDWNNPGNWNPNTVPLSSSNILIPVAANQPTFLTPGNGLVKNMRLNAGAILTIPIGYQITVNGNWTGVNAQVNGGGKVQFTSPVAIHSGTTAFGCIVSVATGAVLNTGNTLTLINGSSLMHGVGTIGAGGSVVGSVRIRRTGASGNLSYNYWSAPISNATSAVLGSNRYMYNPDAASGTNIIGLLTGWETAGNLLTPGRGYIATGTGSANFFGTANNGTINYGPLVMGAYTSFNLIGNPYPSAISAASFVSSNSQIQGGALYFWDDDNSNGFGYSGSDYGVWNGIGFVAPNSGKTFSGDIASCQGFFVQATSATPITFTNSMRTTQNTAFFDASILERVWVSVTTQANDYNETLIAFKGDATDSVDENYDAVKLKGNLNIAMFTKIGNGDYAINALSELNSDKMIQIGIEANVNGPQTLRLNQINNLPETAQIILEDRKLGIFQNLRNNPDYAYTFDTTADVLRFRLHFKPEVIMLASTETCVQNDGEIIINSASASTWNYSVTNQNGETVSEGTNFSGSQTIHNLAGGLYFVSMNNQFGSNINQAIEVAEGAAITATIGSNGTQFPIYDATVVFNATIQGASDMTWDFGDGTIVTGVLNPVHVYTAPGTFTVTFIASNATCMDVKTTFITVQDFTTGIDQAGTEVFSIFPNPANAITDIRLRLPEREEALVINVLDAAGKLVKTINFNSVEKQASLQINVEDLATGVYQLLLTGNTYSTSARLNVVR